MRRSAILCAILALAGCDNGSSSGGSPLPQIVLSTPTGTQNGDVTFTYSLSGPGAQDVVFEFSPDGGTTWYGAAPADSSPGTKQRNPGIHLFIWDSVADGASGPVLVRASITGSSSLVTVTTGNTGLTYLNRSATIDAGTVTSAFIPTHRGHYDLQPVVLNYLADPDFPARVGELPVSFWRISVGRWEIGPTAIMAPEPDCYSEDPAKLQTCSREFYRGPNTLIGAQDPANYFFGYLDAAIAAVEACGAEPYLCFDYTPFTLASNQNPLTTDNLYREGNLNLSFSNGIRTSPPLDNAVYAEVVKRVMMHVNGTFAGGLNRTITYVEIGNEPDLVDGTGTPLKYFWTGNRAQFVAMYQAVAAALDAEFGASIKIGAGSFALQPTEPAPTFMEDFLAGLGGTRLDFASFHAYNDDAETGMLGRIAAAKAFRDTHTPAALLHCPEWGMALVPGPKYDTMTAAIHHAKVLEYFQLLDVSLSHRAVLRNPVSGPDFLGIITTAPATLKPAGYTFSAYEMLSATPQALSIPAINPPGFPMLLAGRGTDEVTILFFHEAPLAGQVGRLSLSALNLPFANYIVDRYVLTDATVANGDGLWLSRSGTASGSFTETFTFTRATLVVWRLTRL